MDCEGMDYEAAIKEEEEEDSLSDEYSSSESDNEIEYILNLMSEDDPSNKKEEEIEVELDSPSLSDATENPQNSILPPRNNWEGKYNFQLRLHYLVLNRKTDYACFSTMQNKLYISKDHVFRTLCRSQGVPEGSILRATLYYISPEFSFSVVKRCPVHAHEDLAIGSSMSEHVLQSLHKQAIYEKDEQTGRFSVVIPYNEPKGPNDFIAYSYKLTCFSSCFGGINRRQIMIYFSLENNGQELGRQTLEIKVCACPSRDLKQEERKKARLHASLQEENVESDILFDKTILPEPGTKTAKECGKYVLRTNDQKLYKFLMYMKEFYESANYIKYQQDLNKYLPT